MSDHAKSAMEFTRAAFTKWLGRHRDMTDLERARWLLPEGTDEIEVRALADTLRQTRAEALEEAARVCEGGYTTGSTASTLKAVAIAIRALKDKTE